MTPEKQQIAIAEACGWKFQSQLPKYDWVAIDPNGIEVGWSRFHDDGRAIGALPDYLSDLNAMHEAITTKFITEDEQNNFVINLMDILQIDESGHWQNKEVWAMSTATCVPLAKAFLKTLNLWTN